MPKEMKFSQSCDWNRVVMFDVLCTAVSLELTTGDRGKHFYSPFSLVKFFRWLLGKEGVSRGK